MPSSEGFSVEMDVLQSIAREMKEKLQELTSCINAVDESLQALNSQWSGPANRAFRLSASTDIAQMRRDIRCMETVSARIAEVEKTYRSCEASVLGSVRSLQI